MEGDRPERAQLQHLVAFSDVPQCLFGALSSVLCSHGRHTVSWWGEGDLLILMETKTEMVRKLRNAFTHGKLPSTDAWQLAESTVSQSWMLKVDFGGNVNEISLGVPGTVYVNTAPLTLMGAEC